MQGLIEALRWMTVLPMPKQLNEGNMQSILPWLPVTGFVVGGFVVAACYLGALFDPWLGALCGVFVWLLITGGLHADGLADLTDALGASHRNKERFVAVLKDPHLGSFGALSLIFLVLSKFVLLKLLIDSEAWWGIVLIPVWARLGTLFWYRLPALTDGFASLLEHGNTANQAKLWLAALMLVSLLYGTYLWLAGLVIYAWYWFLKYRIQGMNGDCLGAGIECSEIALLVLLLI